MKSKENLKRGKNYGNRGGGRLTKDFTKWMKVLPHSKAARKFIEDLIAGEPIEEKIISGASGWDRVKVPAPAKVRAEVIQYFIDRGYGKAVQSLEHSGKDGSPLQVNVINYGDTK